MLIFKIDMPRKAEVEGSGALHPIIVRGIEGRKIFRDDDDCNAFLDRFGKVLIMTHTNCFACLCQQDPYLLELARYIHLNPLRAGLVKVDTA